MIPYPSNQKRGVKDILRGDKKFRTYGPDEHKKIYLSGLQLRQFQFSKNSVQHGTNNVRGLKNVVCIALYSIYFV